MANKQQSQPNNPLRAMPNSVEAEQAVLGAIISDYDVAIDTVSNLTAEDFYLPAHRTIFECIRLLMAQNKPIDIVTLTTALSHSGKLESVGGVSMLGELVASLPSTANSAYYVTILQRNSLLRNIIRRCNDIIQNAYSEEDADKVLAVAESLIYSISETRETSGLQHISQSAVEVVNRLAEVYNTKEVRSGLKVGMRPLDELTNGFVGGQLLVLAARPGCGKTSFCMNMVANLARTDKEKVIAVFNLEMSAGELVQRLIANLSGIDSRTLMRGEESPDDLKKMWQAAAVLNDSNVYIDDTAQITAEQILSKCRRLKAQKGALDFVMIDYLQLMDTSNKNLPKNQQVTEMSRAMKVLAKELKVPVLLLSQMSRSIEQRDDKTPKLSDLRESGAIEQDADMVMFLTEGDFEVFSQDSVPIYLMVAKHRAGATADLAFKWEKAIGQFTPVDTLIRKPKEDELNAKTEKEPKRAQAQMQQASAPEQADQAPPSDAESDDLYEAEIRSEQPMFDVTDDMAPPEDPDDPLAQLQNAPLRKAPDLQEE